MNARIYVTTYARHNDPTSYRKPGKWFDVDDHIDIDDFYEACLKRFSDEESPELMFSDYEVPNGAVSGDVINEVLFDYAALSEDERDVIDAYQNTLGSQRYDFEAAVEQAMGRFCGIYKNGAEYVEKTYYDSLEKSGVPKWVLYNINWGDVWLELERGGVNGEAGEGRTGSEHDGEFYVFVD